jgi:hypothetical protein
VQGLLLAVLVAGAVGQYVIEGALDLRGGRGVRAAMALILIPGIVSKRPVIHAMQAMLLLVIMIIAVSYVAMPIG